MKNPNLTKYASELNLMADMFNMDDRRVDLKNLTPEKMKSIRAAVESDLEPERLTCDGEASASSVRARSKLLRGVLQELDAMAE